MFLRPSCGQILHYSLDFILFILIIDYFIIIKVTVITIIAITIITSRILSFITSHFILIIVTIITTTKIIMVDLANVITNSTVDSTMTCRIIIITNIDFL